MSKIKKDKKGQKSSIGIIMDSVHIIAASVSGTQSSYKVDNLLSEYLPKDIFGQENITDTEKLGKIIQKMFKEGEFSQDDIVFGVKNQYTLMRIAPFFKVAPEKMRNSVLFGAQKILPVPVNELVLDCVYCDEFTEAEREMVNVLIVGSKKTYIKDVIKTFDGIDRYLSQIDSATLCAVRAVSESCVRSDETAMIAYIDFDKISLNIIKNDVILMTRTVDVEPQCYNKSLDNISASTNEMYLNYIKIDEYASQLKRDLLTSINFFQNQKLIQVNKIYLCGEYNKVDELSNLINGQLEWPVETAKCYADVLKDNQYGYAAALNLALSQLEV